MIIAHAHACSNARTCPGMVCDYFACSTIMMIDHAHACSNAQPCPQGWPPTILHACSSHHLCRGHSISEGMPLNSRPQHYADDDY